MTDAHSLAQHESGEWLLKRSPQRVGERALLAFFWLHRPAVAAAAWIPSLSHRWSRITLRVAEIVVTFALLLVMPWYAAKGWRQYAAIRQVQTPLMGAWHLDAGYPASGAFLTPDGASIADFYVDTTQRAFRRDLEGEPWRTGLEVDANKHLITVYAYGGGPTRYSWQMPDANHLVLTTVPPDPPKAKEKSPSKPAPPFRPQTIAFTRLPTMAHYPLLERGFHFVNQWGYER